MKENFYKTGFYSLIALIFGFVIGNIYCSYSSNKQYNPIREDTTPKSTLKVDSAKSENLTKESVYEELKSQNVAFPEIVLAQSILETGHYTSRICNEYNNLFGLRKGKTYMKFSHWKHSIKSYKNCIQYKYKGGDYYKFLKNLGYAEDKNYINKIKQLV